tara:strand:- start:3320 stop:4606 length:1287 start_codon:yes stop_codon:yes gene_type:complete
LGYLKNLISKLRLKNLRNVNQGYIYYLVGEGLSKGIVFLFLGFFTNALSKQDFGKISLFWVSVPLLSVFIDFSQRSYIKYFYIHNTDKVREVIVVIKMLCLLLSPLFVAIFFIKDYYEIYIIDSKSDYFILFSAFFFAIIEIYLSYFQIKGSYKKYNLVFILRNAIPYIFAAIIIQYFSGDVYSFMIIQGCLMLLIVVVLSKNDTLVSIRFKNGKDYLKNSIKFSLPFIPAMISVLALSFSDRFIINYYYSEIEVANYTVAYTVSSIFMAFFMATNKMWQKFILENLKAKYISKISKATKYYILVVLSVAILVIISREFLVSLMSNSSYLLILDIVPTIVVGMFFYFLYTVLSNIPFFYKNTFLMVLPAIVAASVNLILNFILIPIYGYKVAALTTTCSYLIEFVIIYTICLQYYKVDILFKTTNEPK